MNFNKVSVHLSITMSPDSCDKEKLIFDIHLVIWKNVIKVSWSFDSYYISITKRPIKE